MKDTGNNIDELFKSRLGKEEFPYKPEYWGKMDKLLTKFPVTHVGSGATKILGMSKVAFISSVIAVSTAVTTTAVLTLHKSKNNDQNNQTQNIITKTDSLKTEENKTEELKKTDTAYYAEELKKAETIKQSASQINNEKQETPEKGKIITQAIKTDVKAMPVTKPENIDKVKTDNKNPLIQNPVSDQIVVTKDELKNAAKKDVKHIVSAVIDSSLKTTAAKEPVVAMPKPDTTNAKLVNSSKIGLISENKSDIKPVDTIKAKRDTIYITTVEKIPERTKVYAIAGSTLTKGFSNIGTADMNLNFLFGLGYQQKINDKWNFTFDGNYIRRNGNSLFRTSVRTYYFLYKITDSISLTTKSVDFLDLHLNMQRNFKNKNYLSCGLFFSAAFNSKSDKNEIVFSPAYTEIHSTEEKGYLEGISKFSYGLNLDYQHRILKNGFIGLKFNQSLNDLIDNNKFGSNKKDHISEFQFYIKWMLY